MVWAPWQKGLLILPYNEGMVCKLRLIIEKETKLPHLELLVTGNVVGDWWKKPIPYVTARQ